MPRLLVCRDCGIMYRMRDYDGPPEYDMELRELIDRHLGQADDKRPESHRSFIFRTDEETASKLDAETAVKNELAKNHIWVKDFRDELKVDALNCFNKHNRPTQGCIDWCIESKTIGRKTGVPPEKRQYLCMYCPAASYYAFRERKAMGMYDK